MSAFDIDPARLASLLASRVCHDLINPAGALAAGLEVLDEESDPGMREEAMRLIRVSAKKSVDQLTFARIAFGAGGAYADELDLAEARKAAEGWFSHIKPELDWRLADEMASKDFCKALLCTLLAAADSVPRGGVVRVDGRPGSIVVTASGDRARLQDTVAAAIAGDVETLEAKQTPLFIAAMLVRAAGGGIGAAMEGEDAVFRLNA